MSDAALQLFSIPLLLTALWRCLDAPASPERRWALTFCAAVVALILFQLIPLPPAMWMHLPGREALAQSFELLGRPAAWAPISLAPEATWLAALSLLPALAIFTSTLTLDWGERRQMVLVLIAFSTVSAFLGLIQLAQGPDSHLRFFDFTNANDAVGFFANRNHFAALLYSSILLTGVFLFPQLQAALADSKHSRSAEGSAAGAIVAGVVLIVLIVGVAIARSRAGAILAVVALVLGLVLGRDPRRLVKTVPFPRVLAFIVVLALVLLGQSSLSRLLDRFDVDPLADARLVFARNTVMAAKSVTPVGAGLGSFPSLYPAFEKPADLLPGSYVNHAHNDFLELWLETGVGGPILLGVFLFWAAKKAARLWNGSNTKSDPNRTDGALRRASIVIIALILAHSLVDYPLRTSAMMAVFALCCGLLIDPPPESRTARASATSWAKRVFWNIRRPHSRRAEMALFLKRPVEKHGMQK